MILYLAKVCQNYLAALLSALNSVNYTTVEN